MANSWVPQALLEFVVFCEKWMGVLNNGAYLAAFGWNQRAVTACLDAIAAFLKALGAWELSDSSLNKALRDEAWQAAEDSIMYFAAHYVRYNPEMTETGKRELLGVRTWHPGHRIALPFSVPELAPLPGHIRQIIVRYRAAAAERWGKPRKTRGIEIRWAFLTHPPVDIEAELTNSSFDTRHPFLITFKEEDRGKTVYFAGRWEINREGQKGDFGPIASAIVP
jgi:hypothetical protein